MFNRRKNERGATLVEFTFLVPILMTLAIGMFEMGMAWSDKVTATQAVRLSARTITHLGNGDLDGDNLTDLQVDQEGLLALQASMFDQWDEIEFVVVFRATVDGEMESPACLLASNSGSHCNHYDQTALAEINNNSSAYWDHNHAIVQWDWEDRDNDLITADHVGVYVKFNHDWETGYFPGDGIDIGETAVLRMEPAAG